MISNLLGAGPLNIAHRWKIIEKAGKAVKTQLFLCFILKQAGKAAENNGFGSQEDHFENQKGHQTYTLDPCYGFI